MKSEVSHGLIVIGGFVLLASLFSGCQSHMATCDVESLVEKNVESLDKLSVARWTATTWLGKPSWQRNKRDKDRISPYCELNAVSNHVMAMSSLSKTVESSLPVKVAFFSSTTNNNGVIADFWNVPACLSLVSLPFVTSEKVIYTIQAESVVGKHEKTFEICNRSWYSIWTPLAIIPVPGWADFRATAGDFGQHCLDEYHEKVIADFTVQLLSEVAEVDWPQYNSDRVRYDQRIRFERSDEAIRAAFDLKGYRDELKVVGKLAQVKDVNVIEKYEERLKEEMSRARSSELKEALVGLLDKLRLKRKRELAETLLGQRNWKQLRELCIDEKDGEFVSTYGPKAEEFRVEEVRKEMKDALAKGDWQHALTLSRNENDDVIKTLSAKAKECGIKEKGAEADELLAKENWSEVLGLCEKLQSEIELADFVQKYRSKAEALRTSIEARERAAELKRIEARKMQIGKLLDSKDYAAVIAECDKERGTNPGAKLEDQQIWNSFKNKAVQAKAKIDRDTELSRIASKVKRIEQLLVQKDYDSVIKACEEERGTNVGSLPEDMAQWKTYRTKALGLRLLQKANAEDKTAFNIKGFSLGMSMEEVEILLRYYVPSISFEHKDNQIKIANHKMAFCQEENGKVVRINLSKDILEKLFEYDVQTTREWAMAFAKEYSIDLRVHRIRDRKSRGSASVSVSQDCYVFKDRKNGVTLTIFDEQDVDDYNKDTKEIIAEAEQRVMQMMLAGINNDDLAYSMGLEAGRQAGEVEYVRDWLKKTFVNGKGAEEGTLRLESTRR